MPKNDIDNRACSEVAGVPIAEVTAKQLVQSLRSLNCPICNGPKKRGHTLCFPDYKRLNPGQKAALYDGLGAGYEQAVRAAFDARGAERFIVGDER